VVSGAHRAGPDVFGGMVAHLRLVHRGSVDPAPAAASGRPGGGVDRKRPAADVGGAGRARRGRLQRLAQNGAPHAAGAAGPGGRRPRHLVAPRSRRARAVHVAWQRRPVLLRHRGQRSGPGEPVEPAGRRLRAPVNPAAGPPQPPTARVSSRNSAAAAAAPASVAVKLTVSLLKARQPRRGSVRTPPGRQKCTGPSVSAPHAGQPNRTCTVAPRTLSAAMPRKPPAAAPTAKGSAAGGGAPNGWPRAAAAAHVKPIKTAPARPAPVPGADTAPDCPGAAGRPVVMMTGGRLDKTPSSVAHVSAAAAATAPPSAAAHAGSGQSAAPSTAAAATAPLAATCDARRPRTSEPVSWPPRSLLPFGPRPAAPAAGRADAGRSRRALHRVNPVPVTKNTRSGTAAASPPQPNTTKPMRPAAAAPPTVSARARHAATATTPAPTAPRASCGPSGYASSEDVLLARRAALRRATYSGSWKYRLPAVPKRPAYLVYRFCRYGSRDGSLSSKKASCAMRRPAYSGRGTWPAFLSSKVS